MMRLFVINLPDHQERWQATKAAFTAAGLHIERFEATLGAAMPDNELAKYYCPKINKNKFYRPLTPAEIGCYVSHIRLWDQMAHHNWPVIAIFEDDVIPDHSLGEVLSDLHQTIEDWDMVKLTGRELEHPIHRVELPCKHELIKYKRIPSLTGGYVISNPGAKKLLANRLPFGRPIDVDLRHWWECGLRVRGVLPYPLKPSKHSATSTIGPRTTPKTTEGRLRKIKYQTLYTLNNWRHYPPD